MLLKRKKLAFCAALLAAVCFSPTLYAQMDGGGYGAPPASGGSSSSSSGGSDLGGNNDDGGGEYTGEFLNVVFFDQSGNAIEQDTAVMTLLSSESDVSYEATYMDADSNVLNAVFSSVANTPLFSIEFGMSAGQYQTLIEHDPLSDSTTEFVRTGGSYEYAASYSSWPGIWVIYHIWWHHCTIAEEDLPDDIGGALDEIINGTPRPNVRNPKPFVNDGRGGTVILPGTNPDGTPITYTEHTVNPRPAGGTLDGDRIIEGDNGNFWVTEDHFETAKWVRK